MVLVVALWSFVCLPQKLWISQMMCSPYKRQIPDQLWLLASSRHPADYAEHLLTGRALYRANE